MSGTSSSDVCHACDAQDATIAGSTTLGTGAVSDQECIRPLPLRQNPICVSGHHCVVRDVLGVGLQNGHRLAVTQSCRTGEVIVGVPNGGLSVPATDDGTVYHWDDDFNVSGGHFSVHANTQRFVPAGGEYRLCWCPNIHEFCDRAGLFVFHLGFLTVVGPVPANLHCVRGRNCTSLSVAGVGLMEEDKIRIQEVCGGLAVQIAFDNILGNALDVVRVTSRSGLAPSL